MANDDTSTLNVLDGSSFLKRIIDLNLSNPRNLERIVYPLYVIAIVVLLARLSGYKTVWSRSCSEKKCKGTSAANLWIRC